MTTALALAMVAAAVAIAAWAAQGSGKRLVRALVILAFGVGCINPLIEAVVFGVMPIADVPLTMVWQLLLVGVTALIATAAWGKLRHSSQPSVALGLTPVRLGAAALSYALLYLAAGILVFPFVKDFYATRTLPPLGTVVALQLVRGLLYVLYACEWFRFTPRHPGLVLGLVYSVLGGVAPLLADNNPYMPDGVRLAHMVEIGVSNFLFGLVVARLIRWRVPSHNAQALSVNVADDS